MSISDFFFELGLLNRVKRSGFDFLGTGDQTVSQHSYRMAVIGYYLAKVMGADTLKIILISLFHDVCEARTGDLNYVNKLYANTDEEKANRDMLKNTPFEAEITELLSEFALKESLEARICMDADQLEMILTLKEELDRGNSSAEKWFIPIKKRLFLAESREISDTITGSSSSDWWMKLL